MAIVKRIKCGNGNCFLLSVNNNTILIDTAFEKYRNKILKACEGQNIKAIILTHGHIDHIQNAAYLSKKLNAPIAMNEKDYELTKNNLSEPLFTHTILGKFILSLSVKSFKQGEVPSFKVDLVLKDGDSLNELGLDAKVIALPGHTKGSIGIFTNNTDIFVGDALMNIFYPTKSMLYGNRKQMELSVLKIKNTGAKMLHFGHGKSVSNDKFKW